MKRPVENDFESIDWLARPTFGKRENWNAYLFMPFSPKLGERVYLYTPERFNNWVNVEWDSRIRFFNELPPAVKIPFDGKLHRVGFDMACVDDSKRTFLKRLISKHIDAHQQNFEAEIDSWSKKIELDVERVYIESFAECAEMLDNRKEILHFIHAAHADPIRPSENDVLDRICRNPGVTIGQLQQWFSGFDQTTVFATVGSLMIAEKVRANLSGKRIDKNLALVPK